MCASKDDKVGLAIGVTSSLTNNYDAVQLVKVGSEIIGGKGGGGRKDFAQAGGNKKDQIDEAFNKIKTLIKLKLNNFLQLNMRLFQKLSRDQMVFVNSYF